MKKLVLFMSLIPTLTLVFLGCANQSPDPEQSSREAQQRREAERQQAEFRKDLPPVSNASQVRGYRISLQSLNRKSDVT